jgi:hypothetical protein
MNVQIKLIFIFMVLYICFELFVILQKILRELLENLFSFFSNISELRISELAPRLFICNVTVYVNVENLKCTP